jgi:hypothetical protein
MASAVRVLIEGFLDGTLAYPDVHKLAIERYGIAGFVERIQQILSVPDAPLPDPASVESPIQQRLTLRNKTRCWTVDEDHRLLAGIQRYELESAWSTVAEFVGNGRTRSQCSQRWIRVLDPRISRNGWTDDEDRRLPELVKVHGKKAWMKIGSLMGDRSDVQCRYWHLQLQAKGRKRKTLSQITVELIRQVNGEQSAMVDGDVANREQGVIPILSSTPQAFSSSTSESGRDDSNAELDFPFGTSLDWRSSDPFDDPNTWV